MNFNDLQNKDLPEEVWSLIQRGLNHAGFYQGTYMGKPGPNTKKAYEAYIRGDNDEPDWMTIARAEIGTKEFSGDADNPEVVKYLKSVGTLNVRSQVQDETAWCSAFVNWCMEKSGKAGTEKATARSWLNWGRQIPAPQPGCVVVLWRGSPSGWQGHIGFFVKETNNNVHLLGGNQSDAVNIRKYRKNRVLGYRLPK